MALYPDGVPTNKDDNDKNSKSSESSKSSVSSVSSAELAKTIAGSTSYNYGSGWVSAEKYQPSGTTGSSASSASSGFNFSSSYIQTLSSAYTGSNNKEKLDRINKLMQDLPEWKFNPKGCVDFDPYDVYYDVDEFLNRLKCDDTNYSKYDFSKLNVDSSTFKNSQLALLGLVGQERIHGENQNSMVFTTSEADRNINNKFHIKHRDFDALKKLRVYGFENNDENYKMKLSCTKGMGDLTFIGYFKWNSEKKIFYFPDFENHFLPSAYDSYTTLEIQIVQSDGSIIQDNIPDIKCTYRCYLVNTDERDFLSRDPAFKKVMVRLYNSKKFIFYEKSGWGITIKIFSNRRLGFLLNKPYTNTDKNGKLDYDYDVKGRNYMVITI
jgi:hypothetical protein